MEEIEDQDGSFWLTVLSRFAGVSWDEAETNRGNGETTCKRGLWDESADGRAKRRGKEWFDQMVEEHHELAAGKAVGDDLRQVVERRGVLVTLLTWVPACYATKDRSMLA